jgi:hypothetical protein
MGQTYPGLITLAAGDNAKDVAVVDVNADGTVDLAIANRDGDSLSVFLNSGSGVFVPGVGRTFAVQSRPYAITAADFNGDGNPDLAVALLGDDQVAILMGTAVGIFSAPALFDVMGDSPRDIEAGDFDNDGNADIATVNREDDTVSILLGNGDGTFQMATTVSVRDNLRAQPEGIALGDFNGDGNLDFAVTRSFSTQSGLAVALGDGAGGFGDLIEAETGADPRGVVAADMNGDGYLDLCTSNNDSKDVSVLLGAGDGTFASAGAFATGQNGNEALAVGDLNGDGNLDVVAANREGDNVSAMLGDGTGSLGSPTNTDAGNAPVSVALADIDGDGSPDVITANEEDDSVTLLLSTGFDPISDIVDVVVPECNAGCGPAGMMPIMFTLWGIVGLKRMNRRA